MPLSSLALLVTNLPPPPPSPLPPPQEKEFVTAFHKRGFSADLYPRSSANLTAAGGGQGRGGVVALADLL